MSQTQTRPQAQTLTPPLTPAVRREEPSVQPKAYVPGIAVLLAALLAGCTGSDEPDDHGDNRPGDVSTTTTTAQPGRYRVLPEPCGAVSHGALDVLLPGIKQMTDAEQQEAAYEGEATQTFDTDRRVGCRWKVESTKATDHLFVDFERVVSYDNAVSDDDKAQEVYAVEETAADLPVPSPSESDSEEGGEDEGEPSGEPTPSESAAESPSKAASDASDASRASDSSSSPDSSSSSGSADSSASVSETPAALQPRTLDDLGDEAFLNDVLSAAQQRTVTVVFRTSNVIVKVEYAEQPVSATAVPDSKDMQDRARNVAARLADSFDD